MLSISIDYDPDLNVIALPVRGSLMEVDWDEVREGIRKMARPVALDLRTGRLVRQDHVDYMGHSKGFFNPAAGSELKEHPLKSRIATVRIQDDSGEDATAAS